MIGSKSRSASLNEMLEYIRLCKLYGCVKFSSMGRHETPLFGFSHRASGRRTKHHEYHSKLGKFTPPADLCLCNVEVLILVFFYSREIGLLWSATFSSNCLEG